MCPESARTQFPVYKGLNAAGVEIPYSKHDVYIKEAPAAFAAMVGDGEG